MINRILLYNSGGGIGDAIQILPLINSLRKQFNSADFFIFVLMKITLIQHYWILKVK